MCEVVTRGSANSKALGSIALFGGTLDSLAPIAGGLLQKDVRLAADLADTASAARGRGLRCRRRRAEVDGLSAMKVGFVGAGRMGAPMVSRLVGRRPRGAGARTHRREAHCGSGIGRHPGRDAPTVSPTAPTSSWCACSPTTRCGRCAWTDADRGHAARRRCWCCTPPAAHAPPSRWPPMRRARRRRRARRTGQRRPARHRRRPRDAVRRRRIRRRGRAGSAGAVRLRRSDPARRADRLRPEGQAGQQHACSPRRSAWWPRRCDSATSLGVDETRLAGGAPARQRREPGTGRHRRARFGREVHRRRRRASSARTSTSSARWSPNSAATSACSTISSTPDWAPEKSAFQDHSSAGIPLLLPLQFGQHFVTVPPFQPTSGGEPK